MVLCQVQIDVLPTAPKKRIYQLSYADQQYLGPRFKVLCEIHISSFIRQHTSDINVLYNISAWR